MVQDTEQRVSETFIAGEKVVDEKIEAAKDRVRWALRDLNRAQDDLNAWEQVKAEFSSVRAKLYQ